MFWDKNLRNAKKAEKKMEKRVKEAESLVKANDALTDIAQKKEKLGDTFASETWYNKHLTRTQLDDEIREARQNLFIQRDRLLFRPKNATKEYKSGKTRQRNTNPFSKSPTPASSAGNWIAAPLPPKTPPMRWRLWRTPLTVWTASVPSRNGATSCAI